MEFGKACKRSYMLVYLGILRTYCQYDRLLKHEANLHDMEILVFNDLDLGQVKMEVCYLFG